MSTRPSLDPMQRVAAHTVDRDIVVAAGAGTGKTAVLVERVEGLLRAGTAPDGDPTPRLERLLVVTFTSRAAGEMKERIYERLATDPELRPLLPSLPRAWISTLHSFCARVLRESFAEAEIDPGFRVLDETAATDLWDEALRHVFHVWYAKGGTDGEIFRRLVDMAGHDDTGERLRAIVTALLGYARATEDPDGYLERLIAPSPADVTQLAWWSSFVDHAYSEWRAAAAIAAWRAEQIASWGGASDTVLHSYRKFASSSGCVTRADFATPRAQAALVSRLGAEGTLAAERDRGLCLDFPRKPNKLGDAIDGFDEANELMKKILGGSGSGSASLWLRAMPLATQVVLEDDARERESIRVLVALARDAQERYAKAKERGGQLDYSDLELHAARLLESPEGAAWGRRFDHVLVDEFQDVNRLQERILACVTQPRASFRVGDVKQSIYQFRLADPTVFLARVRAGTTLEDPVSPPPPDRALVVPLRCNYRSAPPVLAFVNRLFDGLFDADSIGTDYQSQRLEPRAGQRSAAAVELHLVEKRSTKKDAPPLPEDVEALTPARAEAIVLARRLLEWHARDREQDRELERDGSLGRELGWGDVAILVRSSTAIPAIREELQRVGVPVELREGSGLLAEPGLRDLHALLAIVDNPRDDVSFAAVLRSPMVRLGDSDLLRIRLTRPRAQSFLDAALGSVFDDSPSAAMGSLLPPASTGDGDDGGADAAARLARWAGDPDEQVIADPELRLGRAARARLRAFLERLSVWRHEAQRLSLERFLVERIEETQLELLLMAQGDGARQRTLLERVIQIARDYEAERGPSLRGFLSRLRAMDDRGTGRTLTSTLGGGDAVSILTVHAAKGLEFPVVVLPRLSWKFPVTGQVSPRFRVGREWVGIPALDVERWTRRDTLGRRTLDWIQSAEARREESRILYVATTRARRRLLMFGEWKERPWDATPSAPPVVARRRSTAACSLQWILDALSWHREPLTDPPATLSPDGEARAARDVPLVGCWHPLATMLARSLPTTQTRRPALTAPAPAAELPPEITARLAAAAPLPPLLELEGLRGKYWVTEFKRSDQRPLDSARDEVALDTDGAALWLPSGAEEPAARGVRYHEAIARLDLSRLDTEGVATQLDRFRAEPWWGGAAPDPMLEAGIDTFFRGALGREILRASSASTLEREAPFSLRWTLRRLLSARPELAARWAERAADHPALAEQLLDEEWVLLQGRIDCVYRTAAGTHVIDWKTDRVTPETASLRAEAYRTQMNLYREAVETLWGGPVRTTVVFLSCGAEIEL